MSNQTDVAQRVVFSSEDNRDELTVPPRVKLSMSRCLPTRIALAAEVSGEDGGTEGSEGQKAKVKADGLRIESSVRLEIVVSERGKSELVRLRS